LVYQIAASSLPRTEDPMRLISEIGRESGAPPYRHASVGRALPRESGVRIPVAMPGGMDPPDGRRRAESPRLEGGGRSHFSITYSRSLSFRLDAGSNSVFEAPKVGRAAQSTGDSPSKPLAVIRTLGEPLNQDVAGLCKGSVLAAGAKSGGADAAVGADHISARQA
jgi:hypothetical protein